MSSKVCTHFWLAGWYSSLTSYNLLCGIHVCWQHRLQFTTSWWRVTLNHTYTRIYHAVNEYERTHAIERITLKNYWVIEICWKMRSSVLFSINHQNVLYATKYFLIILISCRKLVGPSKNNAINSSIDDIRARTNILPMGANRFETCSVLC